VKSIRYSCLILMKLAFFGQIFEKFGNIKFNENPFSGSRVFTDGRTDMTKLIVALRNFLTRLKARFVSICRPNVTSQLLLHRFL